MAILAECNICHNKQSIKNKKCRCGQDLMNAKKARKVKYWVHYRVNGIQYKESVDAMENLDGRSIEDARKAFAKRTVQKVEKRVLDMLPESKMNFNELTEWYLDLEKIKNLASFDRVKGALKQFNKIFGGSQVLKIKQTDLESYQEKRKKQGRAPATIDMEIKIAQTMVTKAFDNDIIDGRALKPFRRTARKLKKGSNARKRTVSFEEYINLLAIAPTHLKSILIFMFNTGMRVGEVRQLKWSYIDRKAMFIRLPKGITKEKKSKNIPLNHHAKEVLDNIMRHLNHNFVFTYEGEPIKQKDGIKRSFRTACINAKIPCGRKTPNGIIPHDFRRTVKTNMLNAGIDKIHRDMILGHSLQGMDVNYLIESDEALKAAMDKYTEWIDGGLKKFVTQNVTQVQKNE